MTNVDKGNKQAQGRVFSYLRCSSEPQTWGDSERRQAQLAQDWCKRNGRTLSEKSYYDKGVSGREGKNREAGALAELLKVANENDTILIEDCDRWSREKVDVVLSNLCRTVNRGISVVFLKTGGLLDLLGGPGIDRLSPLESQVEKRED